MSNAKSPVEAPVALIAGPTASGKSDLAVRLALRLNDGNRRAVVINADSAQVYADLSIVSARPTTDEMKGVEHRLFGTWDGSVACSAADWAEAAKTEIAALHADGAVPILCGGTGLYMRTLLEGIAPVPTIEPEVRDAVRSLSQRDARTALEVEDPLAAAGLAPADQKTGGIGDGIQLHPLVTLPDRDWLNERCDRRFVRMMDAGAEEEIAALLQRNLDPALPVMRAIGVREIAAWLEGDLSRAEAIDAGQTATRRYAKRQYTWFRHQPPESWPRIESEHIPIEDIFVSLLRKQG
ncbi:MAG: tRNA (adenosine(37)-N6)-dimethylallyltransferase MiaA [Citromicrobium sp.]|nr:MAG: tRNA (adenosine(37)-N6)-dimethylallyltransferase MiaA [Citromicrobium sp.]